MSSLRHLVISYHTCPTERPGQDLAGGMNVLLRGFLSATRWPTELVTRSFGDYEKVQLSRCVTLHRLPCGAQRPWSRHQALERLPAFAESFQAWLGGRVFDVASAHYWMSATLLPRLGCRCGIVFHTLQAQKGAPTDALERLRLTQESELIARYRCGFLHWHDLRNARGHYPALDGRVVRPGCDTPLASPRTGMGAPVRFGWAARPDSIKNFDVALQHLAVQRRAHPQATLSVAGMSRPSDEQVSYLGPLPPEEMSAFYDNIDQLWNFSHYETFGLGVLEALSRGASVGLTSSSDWASRLRRVGLDSWPGASWSLEQKVTALRLARAYRWSQALPRWERWLLNLPRRRS